MRRGILRFSPALLKRGGEAAPAQPFPGAAEVLDFVAGHYRVEAGTVFASAALAGWTVNGGATFTGSGLLCDASGESLSKALSLTGDFIVYAEFVQPATGTNRSLWYYDSAATPQVYREAAGDYNVFPSPATTPSATRVSFGRSGGNRKLSYNNAATSTGAGIAAQAGANFFIGNAPGGTLPFNAAIARIVIYKATLTDGQIQALGT